MPATEMEGGDTPGVKSGDVTAPAVKSPAISSPSTGKPPLIATEPIDPVAAAEDRGVGIRIATYNINWGNPSLTEVAKAIRAARADVVCFQETTAESERFLRRQFSGEYDEIAFTGGDGTYIADRFGILSRLPIADRTFYEKSDGLFGFWLLRLRLEDGEIQVANLHLTPFSVHPEAGETMWSAMQAVEAAHELEISRVIESLSEDAPVIVLGDFNSMSWMIAPTTLVNHGFIDSFASLHAAADAQPTWHWFVGDIELTGRIDYIFHDRHFRALESEVIESEASDHWLLVTRLVLKTRGSDGTRD